MENLNKAITDGQFRFKNASLSPSTSGLTPSFLISCKD